MGLGLGLGLDKPKGLIYFQNQFSMEFDGVDDRIITDGADTVLQNTTYSFWCKSSTTSQNQGVFGHGASAIGGFHFNGDGTRPLLYLAGVNFRYWNDTSAQDDGKWHHWVVYLDTDINNSKLYVDGVLQTPSYTISNDPPQPYTESLTIGSDRQVGGNSFEGQIDEFAVFDRELTQAEITRMYNTYYTNNLIKNGGFEEIGPEQINNGDFSQRSGELVTNGTFDLGNDIVQNGSFSEIGNEEVTNGDFSQIGAELLTNGDFSSGAGWNGSISVDPGTGQGTKTSGGLAYQSNIVTTGKQYKVVVDVASLDGPTQIYAGGNGSGSISVGVQTIYITGGSSNQLLGINNGYSTGVGSVINSISVKEVGQDWNFQGDWTMGDNVATNTRSGAGFNRLQSDATIVVGKQYKFKCNVISRTGGTLLMHNDWTDSNYFSASGTGEKIWYFTATTNQIALEFAGDGETIVVDDVSIKEVGQHWAFGTGWGMGDGKAVRVASSSTDLVQASVFPNLTSVFKISFDVVRSAGSVRLRAGTLNLPYVSATDTYTYYVTPTSNDQLKFQADSSFVGSIDNISVQEVDGWVVGGGWDVEGGKLSRIAQSGSTSTYQSFPFIQGRAYEIKYDLDISAGEFKIRIGGGTLIDTPGRTQSDTYTEYIVANSGNNVLNLRATDGTFVGSVDNVSVKQVEGAWSFAGWNMGDNNQAILTGTGQGNNLFQQALTQNDTYAATLDVVVTQGSVRVMLGGGTGGYNQIGEATATGTFTYYGKSSGSANTLLLQSGNNSIPNSVKVNSISVKEVGQYWVFNQGTAAGWSMGDGVAISNGSNSPANLDQHILASGKFYKATVTVSNRTTGKLSYRLGGSSSDEIISISENGEHTASGIAGGTGLRLRSQNGFDGSVDNVVVQQLKHQATNLLVNSGDYQSANPLLTSTKSMEFDGIDDYLNVGVLPNVFKNANTLSAWVWTDTGSGVGQIFSTGQGAFSQIYQVGTGLRLQILGGTGYAAVIDADYFDAAHQNTWVYLALVYNGATIKAYRNGIEVGSAALSGTLNSTTQEANIGRWQGGSEYWNGKITEFGLYDRALTSLEIASLYNQGVPTDLLVNRNNYQSGNPTVFNTKQVDFDGTDDYLNAGNVLNLGTSDFSISMWVNSSQTTNRIMGKTQNDANRWYIRSTGNKVQFHSKSGGAVTMNLTTTETFPVNTWAHLLISADRDGTVYIYINGVQSAVTASGSATSLDNTGDLTIGKVTFFDSYFDGKISQVGMWNKALTADEVSSLYNHGLPIDLMTNQAAYESSSNLVGYWRMGSGTNDGFPVISDQLSPSLDHISTTNLLPYSEDLSQWTVVNGTLTPNATVSPDGTQNADKIVFNNTGLDLKTTITVVAGQRYTISFYVKLESGTGLQGRFYDNSNTTNIEYYDYTSQIQGSEWSKVTRSVTAPSGCTEMQVWLLASSSTLVTASFWGAQFEQHPIATTYVKSNGILGQRKSSTTNTLVYSEDFSKWVVDGNASITSNAITSPIRTSNATKLIAGSSSGRQAIKLSNALTGDITISVFAKQGEYSVIQLTDARNGSAFINFDLQNGSVGSSNVFTGQITDEGNGWYRCSATYNSANDMLSVRISIAENAVGARLQNFAGNGTDGLYIWGAQAELQTQATPYIKTIGSPVTVEFYKENNYAEMVNLGGGADFSDGIQNGSPYANSVQNGTFDTNSGWNFGGGTFEITNGRLHCISDGSYQYAGQGSVFVVGKTYKVTFDIVDYTSGSIRIRPSGQSPFNTYNANGTYTEYITASDATLVIERNSACDLFVDNVTVEEVNTGLQGYWKMGDGTNDEYPVIYDQVDPTLGSELVTNGNFATETDWTFNNVGFSTGAITYDASSDYVFQNNYDLTQGKLFKVETTGSGTLRFRHGFSGSAAVSVTFTVGKPIYFTSTSDTNRFQFYGSGSSSATLNSVSVKEAQGNPATMIAMPEGNITNQYPLTKIRNYYRMGDGILDSKFTSYPATAAPFIFQDQTSPNLAHIPTTNLVTYSESINQSAWNKYNLTAIDNFAISPIGTTTASKLTEGASASNVQYRANIAFSSTTAIHTVSVYVKRLSGTRTAYIDLGAATAFFNFDTKSIYSAAGRASFESAGNDWYRIKLSHATAANTTTCFIGFGNGNAETYTSGAGGAEILFWGVQTEKQSQATPYLKSDGIAAVRKSSTTNLIEYSEDFTQSYWTKFTATVDSNNTNSPIGTLTADKITTSGTYGNINHTFIKDTSVKNYTQSIYVKSSGYDLIKLIGYGSSSSNRAEVTFSLTSGNINVNALASGNFANASAQIINVGNDWYRISLSYTTDSSNEIKYYIQFPNAMSANYVWLWGSQFEEQTQAETYAPTKGIPVTIDLFTENNYGATQGGKIIKDVPRNS